MLVIFNLYNFVVMRKMKVIFSFVLLSVLFILSPDVFAAVDLSTADRLYKNGQIKESETELVSQLGYATTDAEKSEVYWRLARIQVAKGEGAKLSKDQLTAIYAKGREYADKAIAADSKNPNGYMWHSANMGRASQLKGLSEQIKVVSVISDDITAIIDRLGFLDISEAWQAISELYYKHPFKSNDVAAAYCRKAIMCIPKDESRFSSYAYFAEMLYSRNISAAKRKSLIDGEVAKFKKAYESNLEKYEHFEGSLGSSYIPVWSTKSLGSMSDREEAIAVVEYAIKLCNQKTDKTPTDQEDYKVLSSYRNKWK